MGRGLVRQRIVGRRRGSAFSGPVRVSAFRELASGIPADRDTRLHLAWIMAVDLSPAGDASTRGATGAGNDRAREAGVFSRGSHLQGQLDTVTETSPNVGSHPGQVLDRSGMVLR